MSAPRKLFVTTALPYANGPFHIGHIMEYIQADIWVRFQRMQGHEVHFVCADDTHGAPIMLKAEAEGVTPQALVARIAATRPKHLRRLPHQLRPLAFHRLARERRAVAGHLPAAQGARAHLRQAGRAVLRSGEVDVPAGPLHQGQVPGVRHEGPVRRRVRELQLDLRADRPHRSRIRRSPARAPSCARPSTCSSGSRRPRSCASSSAGPRSLRPDRRCSPRCSTRSASGCRGERGRASRLADWDISRDAPYFGIPIPDAPGKYFYVWLDAPVGYLASLKAHLAQRGIDFADVPRRSARWSSSTSSARTSSISTRCSGRRCSSSRAAPYRRAEQRLRARLHHVLRREDVEVARHRHQPGRVPRPRPRSGVAALLPRRQAQRARRGSRLQSRRLPSRASTATSSASTSTSRAARRRFITRHFDGMLGHAGGAGRSIAPTG